MKIGIITFQRTENYGAALQCRALYTYLSELGNEVEIVDYRNEAIENAYRIFPKFRKNLLLLGLQFINSMVHYKELLGKRNKFLAFFNDLKRTIPMSDRDICETSFDYDIVIVGSDQVWNPVITKGLDTVYFLNFEGNFRRAGYAISLGDINYPQFSDHRFYKYANRFDFLSFREPDAAKFVGGKLNHEFPQTVDPTLLLTREQWEHIISDIVFPVPQKYIFVYYVVEGQSSEEIIRISDYLSMQHNMQILYLKMNRNLSVKFKRKVTTLIDVGPREFVYLIKNASFVVTSSFHGTALSCIYQKDLSVVVPDERGSRVQAVVDMLHLQDRVYSSLEDFCCRSGREKKGIDFNTKEYQSILGRSIKYLQDITNSTMLNGGRTK